MAQFTNTLLISSLADANPASTPTGYTRTSSSSNPQIASAQYSIAFSGNNFCLWYDNNQLLNDIVYSRVTLGTPVFSSSKDAGPTITDSTGAGYYLKVTDTANTIDVFALTTGGVLSGVSLYSVAYTWTNNDVVSLSYSTSTGVIKILVNGSQVGVDYAGTANNTYRYGGMRTHASRLRALTVEYTLSYSITSVDGDNSIEIGQTGFNIVTTGFTGQPTATTDNANVSVTITGGSSNNWTASVNDRTEAGTFPTLPTTFTLTLTNGAEQATKVVTLTKKSTETLITFVSPVTNDSKYLGYWLNAAGHTADAADFWYTPFGDLVVNASSACLTTTSGTFTGWLRPTTGTTAGKTYQFTVTVNETGVVAGVTGLTRQGLTSAGLTRAGLTF